MTENDKTIAQKIGMVKPMDKVPAAMYVGALVLDLVKLFWLDLSFPIEHALSMSRTKLKASANRPQVVVPTIYMQLSSLEFSINTKNYLYNVLVQKSNQAPSVMTLRINSDFYDEILTFLSKFILFMGN